MEAMTKLVGLRQLELVDWLAYVWLKHVLYSSHSPSHIIGNTVHGQPFATTILHCLLVGDFCVMMDTIEVGIFQLLEPSSSSHWSSYVSWGCFSTYYCLASLREILCILYIISYGITMVIQVNFTMKVVNVSFYPKTLWWTERSHAYKLHQEMRGGDHIHTEREKWKGINKRWW